MFEHRTHYIGGEWVSSLGTESILVSNPALGNAIASIPAGTGADVDRGVIAARKAFPTWSAVPMTERIAAVQTLAQSIEASGDELAEAITAEMGAPISFARTAQVGVAVADLNALIAAAEQHVDEQLMSRSLVVTEPVGVVGAITPWNFPLHQIALKVGAALLAGCTVVLKPSEVAPINSILLTRLIDQLALPAGTFNLVLGDGLGVGAPLSSHPEVDMVTFTGSRDVGVQISHSAAPTVKRVALELGGKSAAIVLDDVDLDIVVPEVLRACFQNSGQTCAALSRALVPVHLLDQFEELAMKEIDAWLPCPPTDPESRVGPLASTQQLERAQEHVDRAFSQGARELARAELAPDLDGAYFSPLLLTSVTPDMDIFHEEVFAPVLTISPYRDEDHAVELANTGIYGLSGGVWSAERDRAIAIARRLRTGTVGINGSGLDVGAPFGGYRQSGIGRECGIYGLQEFLEVKSIMGGAYRV